MEELFEKFDFILAQNNICMIYPTVGGVSELMNKQGIKPNDMPQDYQDITVSPSPRTEIEIIGNMIIILLNHNNKWEWTFNDKPVTIDHIAFVDQTNGLIIQFSEDHIKTVTDLYEHLGIKRPPSD